MRSLDIVDFVLLAALWGLSFLFMRVAAPEFGPFALMLLRCGIGAVTLIAVLAYKSGLADLQANIRASSFTGLINSAIPFVLLGVAALTITTGTLSILNATAPFWGALIAYFWLGERLTRWQVLGLAIGFCGVVLLVNTDVGDSGTARSAVMLAIAAALGATFAYGFAANYTKRYLGNTNPLANATGSQLGATVALLIPGIVAWPADNPGMWAWLSVLILGVFSTGFAYILFFRLIKNIGSTKTITVTFAIPVFGMFFGWLVLDEAVTWRMLAGAVVVIVGCALTIRLVDFQRGTKQTSDN